MTERPMPSDLWAPDGTHDARLVVTHLIKGLGPGGAEHLVVNQVSASEATDIELLGDDGTRIATEHRKSSRHPAISRLTTCANMRKQGLI